MVSKKSNRKAERKGSAEVEQQSRRDPNSGISKGLWKKIHGNLRKQNTKIQKDKVRKGESARTMAKPKKVKKGPTPKRKIGSNKSNNS